MSQIDKEVTPEHFTDTSNAEKINELFGNKVRFDHRRRRWLIWQGHRWQPDTDGSIYRMAIEAVRTIYQDATSIEDLQKRTLASKWAIQSESRSRLDAAIGIAKNLLPISDSGDNWDQDPMLLSLANGILDLTTGKLRDGRPEDRITLCAGVSFDPEAKCPLWEKFINDVFQDNTELIQYVKKSLGYTLSGSVREQVVFFGYGSGSNGKSVLFSVINAVLGEYAFNAPSTLFQRNTQTTATNDIAATERKRFVMSSEILSSTTINEVRIKKWSGGDPETARYLYAENFTFNPTCKIWLFLNHKPIVADDSHGFWRRVRLIPFDRIFSEQEQDKQLTEKLKQELPGILNWLLEGCIAWNTDGLNPTPETVTLATEAYREENDILAEFMDENCTISEGEEVKASLLYDTYNFWATETRKLKGKDVISKTEFGRRCSDKFAKKRTEAGFFYQGITIKGEEKNVYPVGQFVPGCIPEGSNQQTTLVNSHGDSLPDKGTNPTFTHEKGTGVYIQGPNNTENIDEKEIPF